MKVLTKRPYYQQGDVLIEPIDEFPEQELTPCADLVLAHGESGNCHVAVNPLVQLLAVNEMLKFMCVPEGGTDIRHEEHGRIKDLPPGKYRISRVKEYDHWAEEARAVKD